VDLAVAVGIFVFFFSFNNIEVQTVYVAALSALISVSVLRVSVD
jgi:hypothetical protein